MGARVTWDKGGTAEVLSVSNDAIRLASSIPSPPGSRIEGAVDGEPSAKLWVKIHSSKKQPDGSFVLEGRPLNLGKELRERLAGAASGAAAGEGAS